MGDTLSSVIRSQRRIAEELQDGDPRPRLALTAIELSHWECMAAGQEDALVDAQEKSDADLASLGRELVAWKNRAELAEARLAALERERVNSYADLEHMIAHLGIEATADAIIAKGR